MKIVDQGHEWLESVVGHVSMIEQVTLNKAKRIIMDTVAPHITADWFVDGKTPQDAAENIIYMYHNKITSPDNIN